MELVVNIRFPWKYFDWFVSFTGPIQIGERVFNLVGMTRSLFRVLELFLI